MKKSHILLLVILLAGGLLFAMYREGTMPVLKSSKETKSFTVNPGESVNVIAKNLAHEGLIRNPVVFYFVVRQQGAERSIQAGDFTLSPSMDVFEIVKNLQHGTQDKWITVIEGIRKEEIAEIVSQKFGIPEVEFTQLAPEGFLFPDTYRIPSGASSETIIGIMKKNFDGKYAEVRPKALSVVLTQNQVVTLASLLEREAQTYEDMRIVAGILMKRMENDWPLQVDAAVQYALGYQTEEKTWWKKNLTLEDLKIESQYNTYKNQGLPPAPICNPGLNAMKAVVNADTGTPYWYYLTGKDGQMRYSKTLEEHEANIGKYL